MPGSRRSLRRILAALPGYLRSRALGSPLLLPYGRARHRHLLRHAIRQNDHTYTTFLRAPAQVDALVGPVLAHLATNQGHAPITIHVFACSNGAEAYTIASELLHRRPGLQWTMRASDLHAHTIEQARRGAYAAEDLARGPGVPPAFLERTFDRLGEDLVVKPSLRARVSFEQADLLDPRLPARVGRADIVYLQNVLCHMPSPLARQAFATALATMRPRAALFLDGMDLDLRVELTERAGLEPLDYRVREIYEYARRHIAPNWWDYYYGCEPYWPIASARTRRYATIFLKG